MEDEKQSTNINNQTSKCIGVVNFFSCFQVISWTITLNLLVAYHLSINTSLLNDVMESKEFLDLLIKFAKISQLSQISDIVLSIFGCTNSNPMNTIFQVMGRLITLLIFVDDQSNVNILTGILVPWCLADIIRPLYYLIKDSYILTWLRYTLFLVNYPIGASCEVWLIETKIHLYDNFYYAIRSFQIFIMLGMIYLYLFLLKQRKKNLGERKEKSK